MNCREVHSELFAETEGAPPHPRRDEVEAHVATCAACRRIRDDLTSALAHWRSEVAAIEVPDAEREWHAVRRRIHGGAAAPRAGWGLGGWLGLPFAAAAAAAVVLFSPAPSATGLALPVGEVARAENIEAPGHNASTMVFVDDQSGWLIVMASDATTGTAEEE